jgi:hypothetical protein
VLVGAGMVVLCGACTPAEVDIGISDAFPVSKGRRFTAAAELIWVLRSNDLVACQSAADAIRHIQQGYQSSLPITVLVAENEQWIQGFLRTHRVRAEVVMLQPSDFQQLGRSSMQSRFFLLDSGRVQDVIDGSDVGRLQSALRNSGRQSVSPK